MDRAGIARAKKMVQAEGYRNQPNHGRRLTKLDPSTKHRLILCPRGCTQTRGRKQQLNQKKTFDPLKGHCHNCGFTKSNKDQKHAAIFTKASKI